MSYVIQRSSDGAFVTPSGRAHSYTERLQHARLYTTREAAERDRCGNERVLSLEEAAKGGRP